MKKILSIALITSFSLAAGFTIMPYGAYIDYSKNTVKDYGYVGGIYFSKFKSPFKIELDAEATKITYKDKYNIPDWNQQNLIGVVHFYRGYNWDFKIGINNIFIDQDNNPDNYDAVYFGGILYYKYLKYNVGVDYYYSKYDDFHVNQITPKVGVNFGNYYSDIGSFYFETKVNYIRISGTSGAKKDNYTNVEIKLQNFQGKWMTELHADLGKNAYKISNGGFVVYNLGEEYKYSGGIEVNYYINRFNSIKVGFNRSKFEENNKDAYSNIFVASFTRYF